MWPRVGSYKTFYIILEFIRVVVVSELSIVASRSHVSMIAFPNVARLWKAWGVVVVKVVFFYHNGSKEHKATKLARLFGAVVQVHCHGCKARNMKWWKGAMLKERPAHCINTVLALCPAEGYLRDFRLLHAVLIPLPVGLICAGCFWIVQEQSQLRGLAYGNRLPSVPSVSMLVRLFFFSVHPSFPFAWLSALCLCWDKMKADWEVMRLVGQKWAQQIKASAKANSSDDVSVLVLSDTDAFSLPFCLHCLRIRGTFQGKQPWFERRRLLELFSQKSTAWINNIKAAGGKNEMCWHLQTVSSYRKRESVS